MQQNSFLLLFILILGAVLSARNDNKEFVATHEWQVVKEGQILPKGLHIRINFQTGVKEAKLIDNSANQALTVIEDQSRIHKIKNKFRTYDDLKQKLNEFKFSPKTDVQIIKELFDKYEKAQNNNEIIKIINELEFLSHQYDNAIEFVKMNGFKLIYTNLNSSDTKIKQPTLKLLTSIVQNNNLPKNYALDTGIINVLLRILNFETNQQTRLSCIVALGSILRSFPKAQLNFVQNAGFSVINKVFETGDVKIKLKLANLVSDIVTDYKWVKMDNLQDYDNFNVADYVVKENWCENYSNLLKELYRIDPNDNDSIEKCLLAMENLGTFCGNKFDRHYLKNLLKNYNNLLKEQNNGYIEILRDLCKSIIENTENTKRQ